RSNEIRAAIAHVCALGPELHCGRVRLCVLHVDSLLRAQSVLTHPHVLCVESTVDRSGLHDCSSALFALAESGRCHARFGGFDLMHRVYRALLSQDREELSLSLRRGLCDLCRTLFAMDFT